MQPRLAATLSLVLATACERGMSDAERKHLTDSVRNAVIDSMIREQVGPPLPGATATPPTASTAGGAAPATPAYVMTAVDSARVLAARRALVELTMRQEAYFADRVQYATDLNALGYTPPPEVPVRITDADQRGHRAEVVLQPSGIRCVVAVGVYVQPDMQHGVPKCQ